jgi:hypothetical protein
MKVIHCVAVVAAFSSAVGCNQHGGSGGASSSGASITTVASWDSQATSNKSKLIGKRVTLTAQFGGLATVTTDGKKAYYVQAYDNVDDTSHVIRCYIGATEAEVKSADPDFLPKPNAGAGKLWGKPIVIDGTVVDEEKGSGFSGPFLKPCTAKRKT